MNTDHFAFSALQGPSACRDGLGSSGHGQFDIPEAIVLGPVLCAVVFPSGNQAVFVVENLKGTNTSLVTSLRVFVQDGGNPTDVTMDLIEWQLNESKCDVTVFPTPTKPVTKGNIVVSYAPAGCPPT